MNLMIASPGLRICTRGSSLRKLSRIARLTMSRRNSEIARRSEGLAPGAVSIDISDSLL